MTLSTIVSDALRRPVAAIRRYAISLAIAIAAVIAAVVYAASALVIALEGAVGPIWARVALAVFLVVVAVAAYFAPRLLAREAPPSAPQESDLEALSRDQRIALVFEALMLGFSMGSKKSTESADGQKNG